MSSSRRTKRLLAYLGVPAVFCVLGYLLLWGALLPVWNMAYATASMLIAEDAPNFNASLTSIYDPNAQKQEVASNAIDVNDIDLPKAGEQYGQIVCEEIGLDAPVYWFDDNEILAYGVGQSIASRLPGFNGPIVLSAHNTTYFACLQYAAVGNVIKFHTNYCDYEYTVNNVQVYDEKELTALLGTKFGTDGEELIMYTCYPFYAMTGRKTDRLVVFADRTAGVDVKWRETS